MVSLKALKKHGITEQSLKTAFTADNPPDKVRKLKDRIRSRINDGLNWNFSTYKLHYAIDQAYNVPFHQTTATLVRALASQPPSSEDVLAAANQFGLTHLLMDEIDPKTNKVTGKKRLHVPTFFNVLVPLVPAYVKIRAAKITNDRNQTPYFKYEPLIDTPTNRARCELLTSRIEAMTTQMGYRDIGRQCILKALLYSYQLQFIKEEWWKEQQEDDDGDLFIDKEGVRYDLPHPTRTYYDEAHTLASLHSDTGCQFLGYWKVTRYGTLQNNTKYWNTEKLGLPSTDWRGRNQTYFSTVYPCTLQFPTMPIDGTQLGAEREDKLQSGFYTSNHEDSAVIYTNHYERIVPKEHDLGDYEHPVWFRFIVANATDFLYANPLPDVPAVYWGYDPEESRSANPSLALEVLPFQDLVSNLLTQTILSVKQNLANLTLMDEIAFDEEDIKRVENVGEEMFRSLYIKRVNSKKLGKMRNNERTPMEDLVKTIRFPQLDTNGTLQAIRTLLELLERVLVMSAQEIAGQATHEQSAEESRNIKVSTQTRLEYTSSSFDRSCDAWKRQLFSYLMAFGDDELYAYISPQESYTPELLKKIGVEIEEVADANTDQRMKVKGKKKALLQLEYFASTRDGQDRTNHPAMAAAMSQFMASLGIGQLAAPAIGPAQAVHLINQILEQFGFPRDFKLHAIPQMPMEQQQQWVMEQLKALSESVKQFVTQAVQQSQQQTIQQLTAALQPLQGMPEAVAKTQQAIPALQEGVQQVAAAEAQNKLAIARISEVLVNHQELHDTDTVSEMPNANQVNPNPIDALRNEPSQELAVVG